MKGINYKHPLAEELVAIYNEANEANYCSYKMFNSGFFYGNDGYAEKYQANLATIKHAVERIPKIAREFMQAQDLPQEERLLYSFWASAQIQSVEIWLKESEYYSKISSQKNI
jgi:hypothetical protein